MRAVRARRLVPLPAASVAAVCLRSWNRKPAHADLGGRRLPHPPPEVAPPHRPTHKGREHQAVGVGLGVEGDLHVEHPSDEGRDAHGAPPGRRLGRAEGQCAVHLRELTGDSERAGV